MLHTISDDWGDWGVEACSLTVDLRSVAAIVMRSQRGEGKDDYLILSFFMEGADSAFFELAKKDNDIGQQQVKKLMENWKLALEEGGEYEDI